MATKNFKHQINSQQILSEIFGLSKKAQLDYFISLHKDLARDDISSASNPLAIEILLETNSFRERMSIAGVKGNEVKQSKKQVKLDHPAWEDKGEKECLK
jgi:hypothetical protein